MTHPWQSPPTTPDGDRDAILREVAAAIRAIPDAELAELQRAIDRRHYGVAGEILGEAVKLLGKGERR